VLLVVKLRVPVGVIGFPGELSATVAVHVVAWFSFTGLGLHATVVEVARSETLRANLLVLGLCELSPV
jgi:hypothetical protein